MSTFQQTKHKTASGAVMANYELFVRFEKWKRNPTGTYRSDATLSFYRDTCKNKSVTSELQALLLKLTNITGVEYACIYDNTGDQQRRIIYLQQHGVIEKDLVSAMLSV
jgi:hypothetical protein